MSENLTLLRIEQLIQDLTVKQGFYTNLSSVTQPVADTFTTLTESNPKRIELFIQNPRTSSAILLIQLTDKNGNNITFELSPGREYISNLKNGHIYTGEVRIASPSASISYYAYEVERV